MTQARNQDPRQRRRDAELQRTQQTATAQQVFPKGSFTDYKQVKGAAPGLEVDPYGHYRFTPPYAG